MKLAKDMTDKTRAIEDDVSKAAEMGLAEVHVDRSVC
jgi:hypothetical protein